MASRHAAIALLTLIAAVGGACTYGHEDPQSSTFRPLVFPGEARLGASLFMVIDSNQISIGDDLERYDLTRDRVKIEIEGNLDSVTVQPRSVFTVEAGRATVEAEARANTWLTVAFFDLPDASQSQGAFAAPYPLHALLHLLIDNQPVPELEGIVWVIGEGGKPTSIADGTPLQLLLEDELEPQTMVRLRARGQDAEGFDPAWSIAGITAEIQYDPSCLTNPRVHLGSNATGGTVTVGPSSAALPVSSGLEAARIVLTHPKGFALPSVGLIDPTRLGSGPILDIVFDRGPGCSGALDQYFWVRGLQVRDRDGTLRASRPFPSEVNPDGSTGFDASEFFHFHYVDPPV